MVRSRCSKLAGFIRRTVKSRNPQVLLYRHVIEYGAPVWLPHQKNHIECLESVHRRFTRSCFPFNVSNSLSYEQRLSILHLPPLYNRLYPLLLNVCTGTTAFPQLSSQCPILEKPVHQYRYSRINCLKFSSFIFFPRFYESLPRDLRDPCLEPSYKPFINYLRDHLFSYSAISHAY